MSEFALKARYVFPADAPPIADGVVWIAGEQIAGVGRAKSGRATRDLGNAAILPGLVNCHTHLEFSDLPRPLGKPHESFPHWIRLVVARRRSQSSRWFEEAERERVVRRAIVTGLARSASSGVTALGEIATSDWETTPLPSEPVGCTVFREQIGLFPQRTGELVQAAKQWLQRFPRANPGLRPGVSPHAPYTAHPELVVELSRLSAEHEAPLAMHLAESPEELELLETGGGPFVPLLEELEAWDPQAIARGARPLDYLRILSGAHRALVIHATHLKAGEFAFLAAHADRMSAIYCPRTHAYFFSGRYPLQEMLHAGVHVALGTDSLASNPDLDLLAELRFVRWRFPQLAPREVLRMGTMAGARALGIDRQAGSLAAGKWADLAVVKLPEREQADPHELLFHPGSQVVETYRKGRRVFGAPGERG